MNSGNFVKKTLITNWFTPCFAMTLWIASVATEVSMSELFMAMCKASQPSGRLRNSPSTRLGSPLLKRPRNSCSVICTPERWIPNHSASMKRRESLLRITN